MTYDANDLMEEIRVALDQNNVSASLLSEEDIDTLTLDEIIRSKIADAARIVESNAPRHLLDSGKAFGLIIGWRGEVGKGSGVIKLPDDFMRLISFQMSDWERPVTEATEEGSVVADMQHSRYAGIRGNPQRPVVVIAQYPTGLHLEFYSCKAGANVKLTRARYLPYPRIGVSGQIEICEKLKSAVIYYAAYLTALSIGATAQAEVLKSTAQELMQ